MKCIARLPSGSSLSLATPCPCPLSHWPLSWWACWGQWLGVDTFLMIMQTKVYTLCKEMANKGWFWSLHGGSYFSHHNIFWGDLKNKQWLSCTLTWSMFMVACRDVLFNLHVFKTVLHRLDMNSLESSTEASITEATLTMKQLLVLYFDLTWHDAASIIHS